MKLRHQIAGGLVVIGSLGAVGTLGAGSAFAEQGPAGAGRPSRPTKEYICSHQDEAAAKLQARIDKIAEGLTKIAERRATAVEAGNDRAVARLDKMAERLTNRQSKAQQHLDNLPGWIAANC